MKMNDHTTGTNPPPYALPGTEVYALRSSIVDQEYRVAVAFPRGYGRNDMKYPVLYALDAAAGFGTLVEGHRLMSLRKEVCDVLIVGIGYPMRDFAQTLSLRSRDLTPTDYPAFSDKHPENAAVAMDGIGGAKAFFRFLSSELLPSIQERYPADPKDQGILGVSLGGLFAAYCLFTYPDLFQHYAICSPSLWWDDGVIFKYEKGYASNHADLHAKVFLSVGSFESEAMISPVNELAKKIQSRGYTSLDLRKVVFEGETHLSVGGAALWRALREIYGPDHPA
jgi:predicted alpha/beta superfamily hydrolase